MVEKEKTIERKFKQAVKDAGGWSLKLLPYLVKGLPDQIALLPGGVVFFAEIKTTGKLPTKVQLFVHGKIRKLGFKVYVIDSTNEISRIKEIN